MSGRVRLFLLLAVLMLVPPLTSAQTRFFPAGACVSIQEIDGTPSIGCATRLRFSNGAVSDDGNGQATVITGAGGGGDVFGPAASVDSEIAIFSGTSGKTLKRATGTGIATVTAGVLSVAATVTSAQMPNPTTSAGGKVQAKDCTGLGALRSINTDSTVTCGPSGLASFLSTFTSQTTVTVPAATHAISSTVRLVTCQEVVTGTTYPVQPSLWSVDASNNVTILWNSAQSATCLLQG